MSEQLNLFQNAKEQWKTAVRSSKNRSYNFDTVSGESVHLLYHPESEENDYLSRITGLKVDRLETTLGVNNILSQREYGLAVGEIVQVVSRYLSGLQPDIVFIAGDRFEILASCVASFYLRIPVGHLHGGDRSVGGHIDDNARHAITKMAQVHFVVCDDSYQRILRLGEHEERVYNVGSPVVDNVSSIEFKRTVKEPYAILTYHPLASKPSIGCDETAIILNVLAKKGVKTLITSPNNEVGAIGIIKAIKNKPSSSDALDWTPQKSDRLGRGVVAVPLSIFNRSDQLPLLARGRVAVPCRTD